MVNGIDWRTLFKLESPALPWSLLFVVYLLANILVQGWGHFAFTYTMVYTLAFLLIAITLAKTTMGKDKTIGTIFAIMTVFVGMLTWITSAAYITPETGMWITIIFTVIAILNEYGFIQTKASVNNKYCLLAALGGIFFFGLHYFLARLGLIPTGQSLTYWVGPLPWFTILNHLGITMLALTDMLLIVGEGTWENWNKYRWIFFGLTLLGVLGILQADFGLAMLP